MSPINDAINFTRKHSVTNWSIQDSLYNGTVLMKYAVSPVNALEAISEDR